MIEKHAWLCYFSITSSEKVDKENRYADFQILTMPYPGTIEVVILSLTWKFKTWCFYSKVDQPLYTLSILNLYE